MKAMMLPARPDLMQQKRAGHVAAAMQIVRNAPLLTPRRAYEGPQFRLEQGFLCVTSLQQHDERDGIPRQLAGFGGTALACVRTAFTG